MSTLSFAPENVSLLFACLRPNGRNIYGKIKYQFCFSPLTGWDKCDGATAREAQDPEELLVPHQTWSHDLQVSVTQHYVRGHHRWPHHHHRDLHQPHLRRAIQQVCVCLCVWLYVSVCVWLYIFNQRLSSHSFCLSTCVHVSKTNRFVWVTA